MKRRIKLTEGDLHRIVKESVKRVLKEARYAWDLTDDGVDEFDMDIGGYPTRDTAKRYNAKTDSDYVGRKIDKARKMGQDQASGNDSMQAYPRNDFRDDHPVLRHAKDFVRTGQYNDDMNWSREKQGTPYRIDAEGDLNTFKKSEHNKQAAADRRWRKSADSRPLYGKNSPNNDIPR